MRKVTYIVVFLLWAVPTSAQFNLEFHSGYGSYSNGDLKKYQTSLVKDLNGGKVLESFPAFWFYGVDAKWNRPSSQIGLSWSQGSTGGQVYYADYSGFFKEQHLLKYNAIRTVTAAKLTFGGGNTWLQADPRFGLAFATLRVTRAVSATDGTQSIVVNESSRFKAVNPFCEPTLSLGQRFGSVSLNVFLGYHLDLSSTSYRESNGELLNSNGADVSMNLSGLRTGGSIGYYLGRKKEIDFDKTYVGFGIGLDFGGLGLNAMSMLSQYVGLFGAFGHNLDKIGLNVGTRLYTKDLSARLRPYFSAMYGYNTVYVIKDADQFNKTFYGPTMGVGLDVKNSRSNFWTFALQVPIRNSDVGTYKNYLRSSGIVLKRDLLPIAFSLGYRIAMEK